MDNYYNPQQQQQMGAASPGMMMEEEAYKDPAVEQRKAQKPGCRDPIFAALFAITVGAIIALSIIWGFEAVSNELDRPDSGVGDYFQINELICLVGLMVLAGLLSMASLFLLNWKPEVFIKVALWFEVAFFIAVAVLYASVGQYIGAIIFGIFALIALCYLKAVQSFIPFAAALFRVAFAGLNKYWGIYLSTVVLAVALFAYTALWIIAVLGVYNHSDRQYTKPGSDSSENTWLGVSGFFLLLAFYFGAYTIRSLNTVTTAGVMGSFWYNSGYKNTSMSAFIRSVTTSLGSVAFGSLVLAFISTLRQLAYSAQTDDDNGFITILLACIAQCILACLESIVEYINKWGFVYVGLYGMGYIDACKSVFNLFKARGWSAIISDDLVGNVLFMFSVLIGGLCAVIGVVLAQLDVAKSDGAIYTLGVGGFLLGLAGAAVFFTVLGAAVDTIFVCFAEDSAAFAMHHPELYHDLANAWRMRYPTLVTYPQL